MLQRLIMNNLKYHIALVGANIMFGANYSFYSSLIQHNISSDGLYMLRVLSEALFFIPFMFLTSRWRVSARDIYKFAIVALLIVFGRMYLMLEGMNYTSPIDGSIIATLGPIMIMVISAVMIRERITVTRTTGIVLGGGGALTLILSNVGGHAEAGKMLGNALLLASIVLSSVDTVFVKSLTAKYSPFTIMGWAYMIGTVCVLPFFGGKLLAVDFSGWSAEGYASLAYVLIAGTALATALLYYGLGGVSATVSSIYVYTQPIVATLLAIIRGQDHLTVVTVASAALIFAGVFFVIRSYKAPAKRLLEKRTLE